MTTFALFLSLFFGIAQPFDITGGPGFSAPGTAQASTAAAIPSSAGAGTQDVTGGPGF